MTIRQEKTAKRRRDICETETGISSSSFCFNSAEIGVPAARDSTSKKQRAGVYVMQCHFVKHVVHEYESPCIKTGSQLSGEFLEEVGKLNTCPVADAV